MKKIIVLIIITGLWSMAMFANNRNVKIFICSYLDTIPKSTDTSYAQKQSFFYKDTTAILHFDTLTANGAFKQMDSVDYANKLKADSLQKKSHSIKKKK